MLSLHRFSPRGGPKRVVVGVAVAVAVVGGGVRVMTIPMILMLWCCTLSEHALIRVIVIIVILTMEARRGRRRGKAQV